jgi:tRNA-guanine family transglycosylase
MRFYVSWYPGDPWYPRYDDDCAMLISVASVSQVWSLDEFDKTPCYLMLDSGGYRYASVPGERPNPKEIFERQLRIIEGYEVKTILCALDYPIIDPGASSNQKDRHIDQTIGYAYELKTLIKQYHVADRVEAMGVVQGYDVSSMAYCAHRLQAVGFAHHGLGSLAPLKHHEEILERVQAVMDVLGQDLHIFGVSGIETVAVLRDWGIRSVDSSRPAKAAMYNQIFYSRPFRRFSIAESEDHVGLAMSSDRRLSEPLPCDCPACGGEANPDVLRLGKRDYIALRTLHNYWHLKRALQDNRSLNNSSQDTTI